MRLRVRVEQGDESRSLRSLTVRSIFRGHRWLDALWEATVPQALNEEFGSVVMTLIFFSSREMAQAFHREAATGGQSFVRTATGIHRAYGARKRPRRVNPRDNVGDGRV